MRINRQTNDPILSSLQWNLRPFRNFTLRGIIPTKYQGIGFWVGDVECVSVYCHRSMPYSHSDETEKEVAQIQEGKTSIIVFLGGDNSSYMRRMTPEQFDSLVLTSYEKQPDDLWYNS